MTQKEYFGFGSIKNLRRILEEEQVRNIFLVTGRSSYESCGAKTALEPLLQSYKTMRFSNFSSNPKIDDIGKGLALFNDPDLVIAVGGGSVIDMAKSINIFYANQGDPTEYIKNKKQIEIKGKPLIAIPTTTGSGSEATHFAVIYVKGEKYSLAHEFILPDHVILDPNLTLTLPPHVTASSGMDALSQAVESYWSVNSTLESKQYSKQAISLAISNLVDAVKNPCKMSRETMLKAANLAGKAINITKTTAPHAISYFLTSHFNIPHGYAVALTLGSILRYNSETSDKDCNDERGAEYVRKNILDLCSILGASNAGQARDIITHLMIETGLKTKLRDLGVRKSDLKKIAKSVNYERLENNPRNISFENLMEILREL